MAQISCYLHNLRFRLLRYLYDWLLLSESHQQIFRAMYVLLDLCRHLGVHLP